MPQDTPQKTTTGGKPTLIAKPSLSAPGQQAKEDWADSRILSNSKMGPLIAPHSKKQQSGPATASPSSGLGPKLVFAVGGIAVVVIGAYFYLKDLGSTPARIETQETVVAAAAPIALPEPVQAPEPVPVPEQPAQIVNEPLPAATIANTAPATPIAPTPTSLTNALEAGVQPPPAALANALQGNSKPTNKEMAAKKKADALASKKAGPALARPAPVAQPPATKVATAPAAAQTAAPAAAPVAPLTPAAVAVASEKDISLLAALVAHNNGNTPKPGAEPAPANTARPVEESAEALLRRCAALEPERQAPCRTKACAGARATEPACKPVVPPGTAAPAAAPAPAQPAPVPPATSGGTSSLPTSLLTVPTLPAIPIIPGPTPTQ